MRRGYGLGAMWVRYRVLGARVVVVRVWHGLNFVLLFQLKSHLVFFR